MSLSQGVHALVLNPVIAKDSGEYSCLVNNRRKPNGIVKLYVQGKILLPLVPYRRYFIKVPANARHFKAVINWMQNKNRDLLQQVLLLLTDA